VKQFKEKNMKAKIQTIALFTVLLPILVTSTIFAQSSTTKTNKNSLKLSLKEDLGFGDKKTLLKGRNTVSIIDGDKKDKDNGKPSRTGGRRMILDTQEKRLTIPQQSRSRLASSTRQGRPRRLGSPNLDAPSKRAGRVVYTTRQKRD
jgi:hypothetical protein